MEYCPLCLDYALGEMHDELLRKRFERHLTACEVCETDLAEYREIILSLSTPEAETTIAPIIPKSTRIIPFPLGRGVRISSQRHWLHIRNRMATFSVSATILMMVAVVLAHTGHFSHVALIGDAAWDDVSHISHAVFAQSAHLTHHFSHRL